MLYTYQYPKQYFTCFTVGVFSKMTPHLFNDNADQIKDILSRAPHLKVVPSDAQSQDLLYPHGYVISNDTGNEHVLQCLANLLHWLDIPTTTFRFVDIDVKGTQIGSGKLVFENTTLVVAYDTGQAGVYTVEQ